MGHEQKISVSKRLKEAEAVSLKRTGKILQEDRTVAPLVPACLFCC